MVQAHIAAGLLVGRVTSESDVQGVQELVETRNQSFRPEREIEDSEQTITIKIN